MLQFLKNVFGTGPQPDINALLERGAVIVDVRTRQEFASGHCKGSKNIPLDMLQSRIKELPKDKPIITCCASGMRSGTARSILLSAGFIEVYNAGSWSRL
ncbi:MAG TPA: rhodanese-like domain-containing protein [Chitinophagaceae bacterium]